MASALYGQIAAALLLGAGISLLPLTCARLLGAITAIGSFFTLAPVLYGWMGPPSFTIAQLALLRTALRSFFLGPVIELPLCAWCSCSPSIWRLWASDLSILSTSATGLGRCCLFSLQLVCGSHGANNGCC